MKGTVLGMIGVWLLTSATACNDDDALGCGSGPACESGSICIDARCAKLCNTDTSCPAAERCDHGVCVNDNPACRTDDDCVSPGPCERPASAYCRGGTCHYEGINCAQQAPARPCWTPSGTCDPELGDGTCSGVDCCAYDPAWPEGSSGTAPACPIGDEDDNANGLLDGSEAWSGTCSHDARCLKPSGSGCQNADACLSGFCVDDVCCESECGGACDRCDAGGLAGTCTGCDDGYQCAGTDGCRASDGTACLLPQDCASNVCAGSGVCCGTSGACWASADSSIGEVCVASTDGLAWCWGRDDKGQVGNDTALVDQTVPAAVAGLSNVVSISTGSALTTCARLADGRAMCWGHDFHGQLGDDTTLANKSTPVQVQGLTSVVSVSTGGGHTCAVLSGGTAWCWGRDNSGQLGDDAMHSDKTVPTKVALQEDRAVSVAAGYGHSCAVLDDQTAWCWGGDWYGELGDDETCLDMSTPVQVAGLDNAVSISAGSHHTCALLVDGTAWCWGDDSKGQLGDDEALANRGTPAQVPGLAHVVSISASGYNTCALLAGGSVWCWGSDEVGQLGDDASFADKATPVQVAGLGPAVVVAAGGTSCAGLADGTVWCWGSGQYGALGNGQGQGKHPLPVQVDFDRLGFGGTCTDDAECAAELCIDPFATGASACWYESARCTAEWSTEEDGFWLGSGLYEGHQLFVDSHYHSRSGPYVTCSSGWQPRTTLEGCSDDSGTYTGVNLAIDSTGCTLVDASTGDVLATGAWK